MNSDSFSGQEQPVQIMNYPKQKEKKGRYPNPVAISNVLRRSDSPIFTNAPVPGPGIKQPKGNPMYIDDEGHQQQRKRGVAEPQPEPEVQLPLDEREVHRFSLR